jgi:hypothetical protein
VDVREDGDLGAADGGNASGDDAAEGGAANGKADDRAVADSGADHSGAPPEGGRGDEGGATAVQADSSNGGSAGGTSAAASAEPAEPADPGELLAEMRAIRRRARLARHAYWFPLVLFGLLTCASIPFYVRKFPLGAGALAGGSGRPVLQSTYLGGRGLFEFAQGAAYYWLGAMLLGIFVTVLWYRWRGNRVGLRTPARGYLISGLALIALALLVPVVGGRSFRLPLIWPGGYVVADLFPLVLIGLGLCVLAWGERSTGLAAIATGYLALAIVVNLYKLSNVLDRLHWSVSPAASSLPNVVLPALVLLLSGAGAWVVQRRYRPLTESAAEG